MKNLVFVIVLLLNFHFLKAQEVSKSHEIGFGLQYVEIKEGTNYGLVNQGVNLSVNYHYSRDQELKRFRFSPSINLGANYRQGIGLNWHFNLIDFTYTYMICDKDNRNLNIGPYLASNHFYQLYPELQSGHMFWFTSFEIGPKLEWNLYLGAKHIEIDGLISIFSLNSRAQQLREEYFYSLNFWDILTESHSDMSINSINNYLHIKLSARSKFKSNGKMKLGYSFDFYNYTRSVPFTYLTHSIILSWILGKK